VFDDVDVDRARALVADALAANADGAWRDAETAAAVLGCFGVPVAPVRVVTNADDAVRAADTVGYPVVLKAAGADLVHKSDVGGVALGLGDEREVRDAFTTMTTALGARMTGAIVQHQCESGTELIVGSTQDPLFGPIVLFGLGGVTAELLADHALRNVPLTDEDAREQVRALRGSPLLFGYRGSEPVDVGAIENILLRVGQLADALPEVSELDLNPVIAGPDGVIAVDVKVRVEPAAARVPPDLRRLRG
jgi:acyl-CoA synthetase (NDP forming)